MTRQRFGQVALIVVVFIAVGPIIGLIVAAVASGIALAIGGDPGGGAAFAAFIFIYGWLFAHFVGLVPAAIAGAIVAAYAWTRGRVPFGIGVVAGLASMGLMVLRLGVPQPSWRECSATAVAVIWLLAHLVSSIACTRLTRRWQQQS